MPRKVQKAADTNLSELDFVSKNLNEIERIREAEKSAENTIAKANKTSEDLIINAEKENSILLEENLSKIRFRFEQEYVEEENRIQVEVRKIKEDAELNAEKIRSEGVKNIPQAVDLILKRILGGG